MADHDEHRERRDDTNFPSVKAEGEYSDREENRDHQRRE